MKVGYDTLSLLRKGVHSHTHPVHIPLMKPSRVNDPLPYQSSRHRRLVPTDFSRLRSLSAVIEKQKKKDVTTPVDRESIPPEEDEGSAKCRARRISFRQL